MARKLRYVIPAVVVAAVGGVLALTQTAVATPSPAPTATTAAPATVAPGVPGAAAADGSRAIIAFYTLLTDEQRQCLADAGLQRPTGRLTADQQAQLRTAVDAAFSSCGIQVPERLESLNRLGFGYASLTPQQQRCLADTALTRSVGRG